MPANVPGIHHVTAIAKDVQRTVDDEPVEALGSGLQLPPQHEDKREGLDYNLPPIVVPTFAGAHQ